MLLIFYNYELKTNRMYVIPVLRLGYVLSNCRSVVGTGLSSNSAALKIHSGFDVGVMELICATGANLNDVVSRG